MGLFAQKLSDKDSPHSDTFDLGSRPNLRFESIRGFRQTTVLHLHIFVIFNQEGSHEWISGMVVGTYFTNVLQKYSTD